MQYTFFKLGLRYVSCSTCLFSKIRYDSAYRNRCAISSVGRAARLHREGREFKSLIAHQHKKSRVHTGFSCARCRQRLESRSVAKRNEAGSRAEKIMRLRIYFLRTCDQVSHRALVQKLPKLRLGNFCTYTPPQDCPIDFFLVYCLLLIGNRLISQTD